MADKNFNSITFPLLPDKYKVAQVADEYSSSSTYAVGDIVNYLGTTYRCTTAITTAENWTVGHWTPVKIANEVTDLKSALYEIRQPGENLGYITEFSGPEYTGGVYCDYIDKSHLKVYGTAHSWVRFNVLRGNTQVIAGAPTFTTNLNAGTYTLKVDDGLINVWYGTSWSDKVQWKNGKSITIGNAVCVFLETKTNSYNYGTSESPTIIEFELYAGEVSTTPTAVDNVARNNITLLRDDISNPNTDKVLLLADFDYTKPYNIFKGTTFTSGKQIAYLTGNLVNADHAELVTDYIEIDPSKEYLCLNIAVYLMGETGTGLVTGGNRVWTHDCWAFYDANKNFLSPLSTPNATSKRIPSNARYVRLTINQESVIPYAVLFYGNYDSQQVVKYTDYRKNVIFSDVYASTGMENLKMVMFGDSITQGAPSLGGGMSYVNYVNDYLRSNVINVGLGGTRMSQGLSTAIGLGSFASLCENIVSTDANAWDDLETYLESNQTDWAAHVATLKAINWSEIQAVGLLYGANDWNNGVSVGTEYNEDPTKYDGACAYGLKKLLTKYPHLQVIIFTPFYRNINNTNSDTANSAGLTMDDYGASLQNVRKVFHCPIVDSGNELGINSYTIYSYVPVGDGTHPRKLLGLERLGRFFAESIKRYIQPY